MHKINASDHTGSMRSLDAHPTQLFRGINVHVRRPCIRTQNRLSRDRGVEFPALRFAIFLSILGAAHIRRAARSSSAQTQKRHKHMSGFPQHRRRAPRTYEQVPRNLACKPRPRRPLTLLHWMKPDDYLSLESESEVRNGRHTNTDGSAGY